MGKYGGRELMNPGLDPPKELLEEAFRRFNEAGQKLEARYETLKAETEDLRERLHKKEIEIKRSERLAMLGETAAALAHEIRNPLGAIKLFLSILKRDIGENLSALGTISRISECVTTLDGVVSNILQFSSDKKLSCAPVNLHSIIQEEIDHFRSIEPEEVVIDSCLCPNGYIVGDGDALRRVVYNLILNATQAIQHKGLISVITTSQDMTDSLKIEISDNGPGISKEIIDRLFEPFFTTRKEGTGLGLSIAKRIIEQHGGAMEVSCDKGACFSIILPRKQVRERRN